MPKVVVTVCTCERPVDLRHLLESFARLECDAEVSIVVVENSPGLEGKTVCLSLGSGYRWPLQCVVEPTRGISYARNTSMRAALAANPDFVTIVDDDELVEPGWLTELLRVQCQYDADVVSGPVIPKFAESPPSWIERGKFFHRERMSTGTPTGATRTSNILIRATVLRNHGDPWFDPEFALSGGEDTFFLESLARDGRRMIWADEAIVRETVMSSRMSEAWLIRRAFRGGATYSIIRRRLTPTAATAAVLLIKAIPQFVLGVLFWVAAIGSTLHRVRAAIMIAKSCGKIYAFLGGRYHEYARIHRSA